MNARIKATILSRLQPHVVFGIRINPRDPGFDTAPLMIKSLEFLHCTLTNGNLFNFYVLSYLIRNVSRVLLLGM